MLVIESCVVADLLRRPFLSLTFDIFFDYFINLFLKASERNNQLLIETCCPGRNTISVANTGGPHRSADVIFMFLFIYERIYDFSVNGAHQLAIQLCEAKKINIKVLDI